MNQLLIATNNKSKVKELQDLLQDTGMELLTPFQINLELDVIEDGDTYAKNATKKAIAFADASKLVSLADDSGLEVDALDGAPGLYSARYSPEPNATDKDRRLYLLHNLQDKHRPWTARFRATIAIAIPEKLWSPTDLRSAQEHTPLGRPALQIFHGICEGEIIPEERGTGGFGYDPIFLLQDLGKTMAELSMEEKNRLSHRAQAVMEAKLVLKHLFNQP